MVPPKKDHAPPPDHNRPYEIIKGLYISGHPDHANDFLTKGVDAVIDLEGDVDSSLVEAEQEGQTTLYLYWPIKDEETMPPEATVRSIASFAARLLDEGSEVLVHCKAGHNRSGLICARTMIEQGHDAEDAIQTVRDKRGDGHALNNETFVRWLRKEKPSRAR